MKFKKEPHYFTKEPKYLILYNELIKNESFWRNSGQYFMARECNRRAKCLLDGNKEGYQQVIHSEDLFINY